MPYIKTFKLDNDWVLLNYNNSVVNHFGNINPIKNLYIMDTLDKHYLQNLDIGLLYSDTPMGDISSNKLDFDISSLRINNFKYLDQFYLIYKDYVDKDKDIVFFSQLMNPSYIIVILSIIINNLLEKYQYPDIDSNLDLFYLDNNYYNDQIRELLNSYLTQKTKGFYGF